MERSIEILTALSLLAVGLSHLLQPKAWAEFFIDLRNKGDAGVFWTAFIHLSPGVLIVSFHQVWSGPGLIVTLLGCAWTLKGFLYLCFPHVGRRSLARVSAERAWKFMVPGAVFVLLSGVLFFWILQADR